MINTLALLGASALAALGGLSYCAPERAGSAAPSYSTLETSVYFGGLGNTNTSKVSASSGISLVSSFESDYPDSWWDSVHVWDIPYYSLPWANASGETVYFQYAVKHLYYVTVQTSSSAVYWTMLLDFNQRFDVVTDDNDPLQGSYSLLDIVVCPTGINGAHAVSSVYLSLQGVGLFNSARMPTGSSAPFNVYSLGISDSPSIVSWFPGIGFGNGSLFPWPGGGLSPLYWDGPDGVGSYIASVGFKFTYSFHWSSFGSNTYEVIDIWGLMSAVLSMPLTFLTQAFSVTVFAGTPYAFSVSSIIVGLFGILLVFAIVKLIMGFLK